jgi:dTDP-4-dehydrorhamnose reductase
MSAATAPTTAKSTLELWGGIECTRNRVGKNYFDQICKSGHQKRIGDLEQIAALGIRVLRYPMLWEWAVENVRRFDWTWADERLARLKELNIEPIVGFVHHGSGPSFTNLMDTTFATGLASYAGAFAQRYPWVKLYTPVNEPLTTARFSGLYGHWYPHARDDRAFACAMLNQCRAIVLAMFAIRKVNPIAQLIQTEDFGTTYSTPTLKYQADFENSRRWLTFDLLTGQLDERHPMGSYFRWIGVPRDELRWFVDHSCSPDIVGINHYITSDRYLDQRVGRYPQRSTGSNGQHIYCDLEAVRALKRYRVGICKILKQVHSRYHLPVAITEAHLGCGREDQLRWLWQVWQEAGKALEAGVNVRAVTVWSMLGTFDWDSLVTQTRNHYEPGVFDIRSGKPRATGLAPLVKDLAQNREPKMAVLDQPGWWNRTSRLLRSAQDLPLRLRGRPVLITGGRGTLAQAFARVCSTRAIPYKLLTRAQLDIADPLSVDVAILEHEPWAIINAAGYVRVDDAESDTVRCHRENIQGPVVLARACVNNRIKLLSFSSDLVFSGSKNSPYHESDETGPLNVYGQSKVEAEQQVLTICPQALMIRTSAFFGPWDRYNFVAQVLDSLASERKFAAANAIISPTYVPDMVHAGLDLMIDDVAGVWHLASDGECSWIEFARSAAQGVGYDPDLIEPRSIDRMNWAARRPKYSVLGSTHGVRLRDWQDALKRFIHERSERDLAPMRQDKPNKSLVAN